MSGAAERHHHKSPPLTGQDGSEPDPAPVPRSLPQAAGTGESLRPEVVTITIPGMKRGRHSINRGGGIGCGYLLKLTIGITLLMLANSYVVGLVVQANLSRIPEFLHDIRLYQFCQIVFAFILMLVEFHLYDRLTDRFRA